MTVAYRGKLRVTNELLKEIFDIPQEAHITGVESNLGDGTVSIYIQSTEAIPNLTFETTTGAQAKEVGVRIV